MIGHIHVFESPGMWNNKVSSVTTGVVPLGLPDMVFSCGGGMGVCRFILI
jgi:hypothetical protein